MTNNCLYVYLGSGGDYIDGFTHLDNNYRKINKHGKKHLEILADLRDPLPFKNGEVDLFYSIHTFEHLTYTEAVKLLEECFRCLADGGTIRVVVPDMDSMIDDYINERTFETSDWEVSKDFPLANSSQLFVSRILYHDHYYIYNWKLLGDMLRTVEFHNVTRCPPGRSRIRHLESVFDSKESSRVGGDLIMEATKLRSSDSLTYAKEIGRTPLLHRAGYFLNLKLTRKRKYLPSFPELDWIKSVIKRRSNKKVYYKKFWDD